MVRVCGFIIKVTTLEGHTRVAQEGNRKYITTGAQQPPHRTYYTQRTPRIPSARSRCILHNRNSFNLCIFFFFLLKFFVFVRGTPSCKWHIHNTHTKSSLHWRTTCDARVAVCTLCAFRGFKGEKNTLKNKSAAHNPRCMWYGVEKAYVILEKGYMYI